METCKLFPALLQPQVTVVATLGELLATLPSLDEILLMSPGCLYMDLKDFTRDLRATLYRTDDTLWRHNVTYDDDDDPPTSLSKALAIYKDTPWIPRNRVTMVTIMWHLSVSVLVDRWARLARRATELCEAWRRDATRAATKVRQRVEAALGPLERLVAACDKATAFPRELQRRVGDIEAALTGTDEVFPNVPEDLVAKVAVAERLWEANARLAKDHLLGTLQDIIDFYFGCGRASPNAREVAKRCQRAIEDIPRLLQPPERPQSVSKLSPALLQPQVTVVAILGELLATLPSRDEMLLLSPKHLDFDMVEFTEELRATLYRFDDTWWCHNVTSNDDDDPVTSDDDDPPISLSQALITCKSTPWTIRKRVTMAASKWQGLVAALARRWVQLASKATELRNTCREVATKAAIMVATATARARELQDEAAHYGTAQENMVELGQALGGEEGAAVVARREARVRRDAMVAASQATRATMVRQRVDVALGLLEHLVAACEEATAFPQELQHLLRDIKPALKGTKDTYPNVPEDLVAKVAMAEQLWEANTRLAKDHLLGTLPDSITFYFYCGPAGPNACEVAEQCQRAIKDIPRLLRPPERPQSVPKVSPVSMELQELSLARLQPQVTVVAILGQLLDTMPWLDKEMLPVSRRCLYWDLEEFTKELQTTLHRIGGTQWHRTVTSDDDGPPATLSQALATYESTPGTTRDHVTMVASKWQGSVALLVNSWAKLARAATKLLNTCRDLATEADDKVATATARARELQVKAARYGTAQENMVELGQVLGREEGARVVARPEARVRREAWVATSEATRATMVRQRVEAALGLLEGLVAACDEATAFPRELQRLLRDIEATLEGTNEASPDVPEDLVAKVAEAERLWEANAHLAQDHLLQAVPDFTEFLFNSCPTGPRACEVAEQCQRAIEDIPRLLRPLERPQSVSKVTPVSKEPQESCPQLSSARLQPQVSVVAILGKLLATLPSQDKMKVVSAVDLYRDLEEFTKDLWATLYHIDGTWWCRDVTVDDDDPVTSLSQALAAYESTPWTPPEPCDNGSQQVAHIRVCAHEQLGQAGQEGHQAPQCLQEGGQ
ncbi:uncharacterized protein LOC132340509 isoform X2 [Haemorhous mexicanus]|uniref:uncharacterized protein LOC132340509 isoform X2 n=1 Tax=Haemorhous mexicanus TaxID=30427 RepID=UPI0028BE3F42|nr:uncharacterized protein LOC132340509 isoform X2 [Haemorhous mexicanus]